MSSKKRGEDSPIVTAEEHERNLALFESWLKGATWEILAERSGLSVRRLYELAKQFNWRKHKKAKVEADYERVARRVKKTEKLEGPTYPGRSDWPGGFYERTIRVRPGVTSKNFFLVPPDPRSFKVVTEDPEKGTITIAAMYPKNWRSPFNKKGTNED